MTTRMLAAFLLAAVLAVGSASAAGSLCRAGGARCFTATATALTGYRPGPLFKSPSDAAWVTFAKRLGLPALVNLKDYKMVLSQALKGQERRAATNDKLFLAPRTVCDQCRRDNALRICAPCRTVGLAS